MASLSPAALAELKERVGAIKRPAGWSLIWCPDAPLLAGGLLVMLGDLEGSDGSVAFDLTGHRIEVDLDGLGDCSLSGLLYLAAIAQEIRAALDGPRDDGPDGGIVPADGGA